MFCRNAMQFREFAAEYMAELKERTGDRAD